MRRLLMPLVAFPFAAVPFAARAQSEDGEQAVAAPAAAGSEEAAAEDPAREETAEASPPGDTAGGDVSEVEEVEEEGGKAPSAAPESYTVQTGDTLWNLSQRFLNNPWYWPKIWSYNQDVDNPNWIRPGTVLRFYPGAAPIAANVPQQGATEEPEAEPEFQELGEGGGFEGSIGSPFGSVSQTLRRSFFLAEEDVSKLGELANSPEDKMWLAANDRVYVNAPQDAETGTVFQVFRTERDVRHPVTGWRVGRIVSVTGEVRLDQAGREKGLGTIVSAWDLVERGNAVGKLPLAIEPTPPRENAKNVKGYVVDAAPASLSFLGQGYVVVLDKGQDDGVEPGNTFTIVRSGDPYSKQYSGMPDEEIGEVQVLETTKTTSTGMLTSAVRIVVPGDRVEMRTR